MQPVQYKKVLEKKRVFLQSEQLEKGKEALKQSLIRRARIHDISKYSIPLTAPCNDGKGRVIQLVDHVKSGSHVSMKGIMQFQNGDVHIVESSGIKNSLNPEEPPEELLHRLQQSGQKEWDLVYMEDVHRIYVWPTLRAASIPHWKRPKRTFEEMKGRLVKADEVIEKRHLSAAKNELQGKFIFRPSGIPYNHVKEVLQEEQSLNKVEKWIRNIEDCIERAYEKKEGNPLSKEEQAQLQSIKEEYSRLRGMIKENFGSNLSELVKSHSFFDPEGMFKEAFLEKLQAQKLTESYNASNPDHPVPEEGEGGGSIGGIGNEVGVIQGLFDSPEAAYEKDHVFCFPVTEGGEMLLNQQEITQIQYEIALGIFVHHTIPFFSLHFNGDSNMYPIIHPAYQGTDVGETIAMLDYYMKGFLNGGFFDKDFVFEWNKNPQPDREDMCQHLIDLHAYCLQHGKKEYRSIKEILKVLEKTKIGVTTPKDPAAREMDEGGILSDYSAFRSSFRIIAKQNAIRREDNVFIVDGDFDVRYTISPDPAYEEELHLYQQRFGQSPPAYQRLELAYQGMASLIKELMPELPKFKKLFAKLKVINFFSFYYNTLKKEGKVPFLLTKPMQPARGCPPLFPHLPIRAISPVKIPIGAFIEGMTEKARKLLFTHMDPANKKKVKQSALEELLCKEMKEYVVAHIAPKRPDPEYLEWKTYLPFVKDVCTSVTRIYQEFRVETKEALQKLYTLLQGNRGIFRTLFESGKIQEGIEGINQTIAQIDKSEHMYVQSSWRQLQEKKALLQGLKKKYENPAELFREGAHVVISLPTIELYHQQSEEQRNQHKRIVGGCGIDFSSAPAKVDIEVHEFAHSFYPQMRKASVGTFEPMYKGRKQGGVFSKVSFFDFPISNDASQEVLSSHLYGVSVQNDLIEEQLSLLEAIAKEDESAFIEGIEKSKKILELRDPLGVPLLHHAAGAKNPLFLALLIDKGVDLFATDKTGCTALHRVILDENMENGEVLLDHAPELLEKASSDGITPLYYAVLHRKHAFLTFLLQRGADVNSAASHGMTPLMSAIHHKDEKMALELIKSPDIHTEHALDDQTTALIMATERGLEGVVAALIRKKANVHAVRFDSYTPFLLAAKKGSIPLVRQLLQAGADKDQRLRSGKTALFLAAENDHHKLAIFLLEQNVDCSLTGRDGDTPLLIALKRHNRKVSLPLITHLMKKEGGEEEVARRKAALLQKDKHGRNAHRLVLENQIYYFMRTLFTPFQEGIDALQCSIDETIEILSRNKISTIEVMRFIERNYYLDNKPSPRFWEVVERSFKIAVESGNILLSNSMISRYGKFREFEKIRNFVSPEGLTLYHYAAKHNDNHLFRMTKELPHFVSLEKIMTLVVQNRAMATFEVLLPRLSKQQMKNLLKVAVEAAEKKMVEKLFLKVGDVSFEVDEQKRLLTHIGARRGDGLLLNQLVTYGIPINAKDRDGFLPLHYLISGYHNEALELFLKEQKSSLQVSSELYCFAVEERNREALRLLLQHTKGEDGEAIKKASKQAVEMGDLEALEILLDYKMPLEGLLECAAAHNQKKAMSFLLSRGAPLRDALSHAAENGHEESVVFLLHHGASLNLKQVAEKARAAKYPHIALLLEDPMQLERQKEEIRSALERNDEKAFFKAAKSFPINRAIGFIIEGKKRYLPLLHLIYEYSKKVKGEKKILDRFVVNKELENSQDEKGDTIWHRVAKEEKGCVFGEDILALLVGHEEAKVVPSYRSLESFSVLDEDFVGVTPFHVFLTKHSQSLFKWAFNQAKEELESSDKEVANYQDEKGVPLLFYAIKAKKKEAILFLLEKGADPSIRSNGETPASLAAQEGDIETLKELYKRGADFMIPLGEKGHSLAHIAVEKGYNEILCFLSEKAISLQEVTKDGVAPLHIAAHKGDLTLVRFLTYAGASLYVKDKRGRTPIDYALIYSSSKELFDFLDRIGVLDHKDKEKAKQFLPLHAAALNSKKELLRYMIRPESDLEAQDEHNKSVLPFIVEGGNEENLRLFLDSPLAQDIEQIKLSVQAACHHDDPKALSLLLPLLHTPDSTLNEMGMTAFHFAAVFGAEKCGRMLLEKGADPYRTSSAEYWTPLAYACLNANHRFARFLVDHIKKDGGLIAVNERNPDWNYQTFLHMAVLKNNFALAALLVENKADCNLLDKDGKTPLQYAADKNLFDMGDLLILGGAKEDLPESYRGSSFEKQIKETAAAFAAARVVGRNRIHLSVLLKKRLFISIFSQIESIHDKDLEGCTPLHLAVNEEDPLLIESLMTNGAFVDAEDQEGHTPLYYASVKRQNRKVAHLLLELGADGKVVDKEGVPLLYALLKKGHRDRILMFKEIYEKIVSPPIAHFEEQIYEAIENEDEKSCLLSLMKIVSRGGDIRRDAKKTLIKLLESSKDDLFLLMLSLFDFDLSFKPNLRPITAASQIDDVTLQRFPPRPTLQSRSSSEILHSDSLNLSAPAIGRKLSFKGHGRTVLDVAIATKKLPLVAKLLQKGAPIELSHFQRAYKEKNKELFLVLFEKSKNPLKEDLDELPDGLDPFFTLIHEGFDLFSHKTLLHMCVDEGEFEIAEFLLWAGYSPLEQDEDGYTPLSLALEDVEENKAFVDLLTPFGFSGPQLLYAIKKKEEKIFRNLLRFQVPLKAFSMRKGEENEIRSLLLPGNESYLDYFCQHVEELQDKKLLLELRRAYLHALRKRRGNCLQVLHKYESIKSLPETILYGREHPRILRVIAKYLSKEDREKVEKALLEKEDLVALGALCVDEDHNKAKALFEKREDHPYALSMLSYLTEDATTKERYADRALEMNRKNEDALVEKGVSLLLKRDLKSAKQPLEEALALFSKNDRALSYLGYVQHLGKEEKDDYKYIEHHYLKALASNPENDLAITYLGWLYTYGRGDLRPSYAKAKPYLLKSKERNGKKALAYIYLQEKSLSQAEKLYVELRADSPQDKEVHAYLADAQRLLFKNAIDHAKEGKKPSDTFYKRAKASYQKALAIDPGYEHARKGLQALEKLVSEGMCVIL